MIPKCNLSSSDTSTIISTNELREECGIFGIYSTQNIDTFSLTQFGMFALQHRGQEACGLSVLKNGNIHTHKSFGLVLDAFRSIENIEDFQGNASIGHTRYATTGEASRRNIQPLYAGNQFRKSTLSIAHNGNLIETETLRKELEQKGLPFLATSDTEVMLRNIQYLKDQTSTEQAILSTMNQIKGAYSVLMIEDNCLYAFRDPNGIRPLCYGKIDENTWVFSSESCGLDAVGAVFIDDVQPGEIIKIDKENGLQRYQYPITQKKSCAFEFIYFSRPDTIMEKMSIYDVRLALGRKLFEQSPIEADLIVGVPDSGIPAAIGFSKASGIPFEPILVKNRYMSRSFIVPTQEMREKVVKLKLNPICNQFKDKKVVIMDDSIVRGTTSKQLVAIIKEAGAKEIHFRSASPKIIAPCFLGIDTPDIKQLIAAQKNHEELIKYLEVDSLDFLTIENLTEILGSNNHCIGCFTNQYPIKNNSLQKILHENI